MDPSRGTCGLTLTHLRRDCMKLVRQNNEGRRGHGRTGEPGWTGGTEAAATAVIIEKRRAFTR